MKLYAYTRVLMALLLLLSSALWACGGSGSTTPKASSASTEKAPSAGYSVDTAAAGGESAGSRSAFPSFSAQDLDGNTITNDIFFQKDITVMNIWGTFCPPCIREMPELGDWVREMPENVQLLGLVVDIDGPSDADRIETARNILDSSNASFLQIIPSEDLAPFISVIYLNPWT